MARILYGLCGVGIGHVIRTRIVASYLQKKNEVMIVCGGRAYQYLKNYFKNVVEIPYFNLWFRNNRILNFKSFFGNLLKINIKNYKWIKDVFGKVKKFNPELAISDWESFSSFTARKLKIPIISLDNQHFLVKGDYSFLRKHYLQYLKAKLVLKLLVRKADYYITVNFYDQILKKESKNCILVPPIIREEILNAKVEEGNYFLVYQSTKSYKKLIKILRKVNTKFVVYGLDLYKKEANMTFKKFSDEFINDLINCKGVICNGGFVLISEAIFLKKPILSIPIRNHFEQLVNAFYVESHDYGEYCKKLDIKTLEHFIKSKYHIKNYTPGNKEVFKILEEIIKNGIPHN